MTPAIMAKEYFMSESFLESAFESTSNDKLTCLMRVTAYADYYSLLALLFQLPNYSLIMSIREGSFSQDYHSIASELGMDKLRTEAIVSKLVGFEELVKRDQIELRDLRIAYTRLFGHPKRMLIPPYEGPFIDSERVLKGNKSTHALSFVNSSAMDAKSMYRQAQLKNTGDINIPPDCITIELEFMSYLYMRTAKELIEGEDENVTSKTSNILLAFRQKHVAPWMPAFFKRCQEQGQETPYVLAGDIGSALMEYEGLQ